MSYPNQQFVILDEDERVQIVTLNEWANWMGEHRKERILERDEIDGYLVSTIFLGLDHQWVPDGRPLYWETMIFNPPDDPKELGDNIFMERYSTAKEARAGHAAAIAWLKKRKRQAKGT